jgi:MFS family permease
LISFVSRTKNEAAGGAVVGFIFINIFFFDIVWTPLLQAYPVEIFPYNLRGRGLSVAYLSTVISLIIAQFVNPIVMKTIGWKYYIVFCCLLAAFLAIVPFPIPKTKGRSLEEIAEIFDGRRDCLPWGRLTPPRCSERRRNMQAKNELIRELPFRASLSIPNTNNAMPCRWETV